VRYEQGVLGGYRLGMREKDVLARSECLMAVVYAQIEGFFDSVDGVALAGAAGGGLRRPLRRHGRSGRIVERYREGFISVSSG
jgi:hypothetical protein